MKNELKSWRAESTNTHTHKYDGVQLLILECVFVCILL